MATDRLTSFGQFGSLTWADRFGRYLSERQVRRFVDDIRGLRVADIGCGFEAALVAPWLDQVKTAHLVDLQLEPDLKRRTNVNAIEGRLPEAAQALPTEELDVVLLNSVLEHLWEPEILLREIHRALAPGGVALVNVPSWRGKFWLELFAFRFGWSPAEEMEDHKRYYDVKDLWPLLVKAGFSPSRIRCFSHKFGLNTFAVLRK